MLFVSLQTVVRGDLKTKMTNSRYFWEKINFADDDELKKCLKHFSDSGDLSINILKFKCLVKDLLTDSYGKSYYLSGITLNKLFNCFDSNSDGKIDIKEFSTAWNDFIKPLVKPITALLIIDVQNDFIDGTLALRNCPAKQEGKDILPVINNLLDKFKFDIIVYSLDYHPEDHISFLENVSLYKLSDRNMQASKIKLFDTVLFEGPPEISQKLWPAHCIQKTWGCELHEDLKQFDNSLFIHKGVNSKLDSYSAFFDNMKQSSTVLHEELQKRGVTHVFVCGLAFDYCVAFTALDAIELGYATVVIEDATKGTDDEIIRLSRDKLISHNCVISNSCEIEGLLSGKDRKAEFAYVFAQSLSKI